ncbi:MAG: pyridoxamine 5'-phosphate oxidase family protein [Bacteroidales bacterium]|nr:pyridoxamine 5'-phosphate oxidase family protein [Bacteroidales bacterium]
MKSKLISICSLIVLTALISPKINAQSAINRDTLMFAAKEIIKGTNYCGLATVDASGQPQMRTMNPFPVNDEFITWFATSRSSRKVKEIKNNPKVCVYYADHSTAKGYVSITGTAEVIDDRDLLVKMKRDYWNGIPKWETNFVLIKIVPKTMEVVNYKRGLSSDPNTFSAPKMVF